MMARVFQRTSVILSLTLLAGCSTEHEFRVAGVGSESAQPTAENTTVAGESSPLVVAAGNVLLGRASQLASISPVSPGGGVVDGTVSAVLVTTGQTLVELPDGSSLLLKGSGAALGDLVSIDASKGVVVSGTGQLIGGSVLGSSISLPDAIGAPPVGTVGINANVPGLDTSAAGQLLTGVSAGAKLGTQRASTTVVQTTSGAITNATGAVNGLLGALCC